MAVPHENRNETTGGGRARTQTRTLGVLVAVMVVAGVVALILTLFGNDSGGSQAASEPSGSQVGNQTRASAAPTSSASAIPTAPTSTNPTSTSAAPTSPGPTSTAPTPKATSSGSAGSATKIVKYRVQKGDNLTLIASWFHQRGYGLVYDWNKSVIGRNPNLIHPGQTIIVSLKGDHLKVATKTT